MRLTPSFPLRKMRGNYLLFCINPTTLERNVANLNDTAAMLWQKFSSAASFTERDLIDTLIEEYEIDFDIAQNDVAELLQNWREGGFLQD